jgi:hypothetical protein
MVKKTMNFLVLFGAIAALGFLSNCSKDETEPAGSKTALDALIVESQELHDGAVEGTSVGFYVVGSKATFQTAINAAKDVSNTSDATQSTIDAAKANLNAAKTTFEGEQIQDVSTDGLVAQWLFDGGAMDHTGNGFDGAAAPGDAFWGSGAATLTTDRFGNEDNAYHFDEGGHIEIPYATALNPATMSLSWWVYMEEQDNNDYMISMSRWNCYKVNLQTEDRVFFTTKTPNPDISGEFIYNDRDNDGDGLDAVVWYHLTVTFGAGHMIFYIDGAMVKDWDNVSDAAVVNISAEPVDLVFGQDLPNGVYADDGTHNVAWGGYFKGKLDDIRLYNRVLSSQEVSSIYNLEKPQ